MAPISLGDLFRQGFDLLRRQYKKLLVISLILFSLGLAANYIIQLVALPAEYAAIFPAEFAFINLVQGGLMSGLGALEGGITIDGNQWNGSNDFSPIAPSLIATGANLITAWILFLVAMLLCVLIFMAIAMAVSLVQETLNIGGRQASLTIARNEPTTFDKPFRFFGRNWKRCLGITAWTMLWTTLWSFLFVIPGIIKGYSYRLAPYLIIDYPGLTVREALKKSMEITNGHKGKLFVIDLAVIGFTLCAVVLACCLYVVPIAAALFFITPFTFAVYAVTYLAIRQEAQGKGLLPADPAEQAGPAIEGIAEDPSFASLEDDSPQL